MGRALFDDLVFSGSGEARPPSVRTLPLSLAVHALAVAALTTFSMTAVRQEPLRGAMVFQPDPRPARGAPRAIVKGGGARPSRRPPHPQPAIVDPGPPVVVDVPPTDVHPDALDGTADDSPACLTGCVAGEPGGSEGSGSPGSGGTGEGPGPPLRVGGDIREPRRIHVAAPVYPELARRAHVQGRVVLECVIDTDGRVTDLRVVSGHPLLSGAATDAVRHWVYSPTTLNGQPIRVILTVTVTFKLAGA